MDWISSLNIGDEIGTVRYGCYRAGIMCGRTPRGKLMVQDSTTEEILTFSPNGRQVGNLDTKLVPAAEAHDKIVMQAAYSGLEEAVDDLIQYTTRILATPDLTTIRATTAGILAVLEAGKVAT